ncbi:uncharacterized protein LOC117787056 [Drosophila innubila]|uniref:uncharacterized protein LOC117787056 n=1 Tax=Drosophila innubila TaxID=198719 RepID=UPI00148D8103|nr:uncharacterized protein LOC117787056 [Drosophila innubila]
MQLLLSIEALWRMLLLLLVVVLTLVPLKVSGQTESTPKSRPYSRYCNRFAEEVQGSRPLCEKNSYIVAVRRCHFFCSSSNEISLGECNTKLPDKVEYPKCKDLFCTAAPSGSDSEGNFDEDVFYP